MCGFLAPCRNRFHNMSPDGFESTFIKAGGSETKGLGQKRRDNRSEPRLGFLDSRMEIRVTSEAHWAVWIQETSYRGKRRVFRDRFRGLVQDKLLLPTAPLVASLMRTFGAQEKVQVCV